MFRNKLQQSIFCRGINTEKKEKILQDLAIHMNPRKTFFWEELPTGEHSKDIIYELPEVE